jgi:hypothetical protein
MDRSLLKLTKFVFVLSNDYSKVFRNGVNIIELKSEIFGSQGYIQYGFNKILLSLGAFYYDLPECNSGWVVSVPRFDPQKSIPKLVY